jgi:hypothetical protein
VFEGRKWGLNSSNYSSNSSKRGFVYGNFD